MKNLIKKQELSIIELLKTSWEAHKKFTNLFGLIIAFFVISKIPHILDNEVEPGQVVKIMLYTITLIGYSILSIMAFVGIILSTKAYIDDKSITFDTNDQTIEGFKSGRCDVLTTDQSGLYSLRLKLEKPDSAIVLPEIISKEPLGPVVRQGDDKWFNIVKWTLNAMINAEEMGVSSKNVDEMKKSKDPAIGRLMGGQGEKLGLDDNWSYNIIKQVGNYAESFEANVGAGSPLKIGRGVNALWNKGGIMYAPPIR